MSAVRERRLEEVWEWVATMLAEGDAQCYECGAEPVHVAFLLTEVDRLQALVAAMNNPTPHARLQRWLDEEVSIANDRRPLTTDDEEGYRAFLRETFRGHCLVMMDKLDAIFEGHLDRPL